MTPLQQRLHHVLSTLPAGVQLVAVSKYHPVSALREAYDCGQRVFGESRVQELQEKHAALPADIAWHFIGHLQQNKVKYLAPYVSLIHAVDSLRLLQEIDRQGLRHREARLANGLPAKIEVLLQLHVAQEETKFGLTIEECRQLLAEGTWKTLENVQIAGLMCMASNTDDEAQIAREFSEAERFFHEAQQQYFAGDSAFRICSWGMSDDYPIALRHGATHVRIGSYIFGPRQY